MSISSNNITQRTCFREKLHFFGWEQFLKELTLQNWKDFHNFWFLYLKFHRLFHRPIIYKLFLRFFWRIKNFPWNFQKILDNNNFFQLHRKKGIFYRKRSTLNLKTLALFGSNPNLSCLKGERVILCLKRLLEMVNRGIQTPYLSIT